jgi:23S rRNA (uracil1939-C5)-methyltransferase
MDREVARTFEIELTALTYGGDALGRLPDGRVIFVPYGLPGEKVNARLVKEKRGYVIGELVEILVPSPDRIKPRCMHFGTCGGCQFQHMPYSRQLETKADILKEQLVRFGGIQNPPVRGCIPSSPEWNYRNHIQFHLDSAGKLGFLGADSHTVVPIKECHLPEKLINTIWPELDFEPVPGLEKINFRVGRDDEVAVVLEGSDPQPPEMSLDLPLSVIYKGPAGSVVLAGDESLTIEVAGRPFLVSAGSFFQVNTSQAGAMVQHVVNSLELLADSTVLDIYCGVGLFSAFLAEHAGKVVGIEESPEACGDFAVNLEQFENVELYQGTAETILPSIDLKPDIIICDPPRAGIERQALQAILTMHPSQIVYVSCDPSTLARDLRYLVQGGYQVEDVTPFTCFPRLTTLKVSVD